MAPRKAIPSPAERKAPAKAAAERRVMTEVTASGSSNANRLLREAAWSRMFGRVESKNPFAR